MLQIKELVCWCESLTNKRGYSTKIKDLIVRKYKEIFWEKIEGMLEIADKNITKIKQDLVYERQGIILLSDENYA